MFRRISKKDVFFRILSAAVTSVLLLLMLVPFLLMISVSFQTMDEIYASKPVLIPSGLELSNYSAALAKGNWGRYFLNSLVVTTVVTAVSLVINSMAGYVFARLKFPGRRLLFILILTGMMIPPQATLIPVFSILRGMPLLGGNDVLGNGGTGLYNTYTGLILPFLAGAFGVFFCKQYYSTIPHDIDDAANIDGCGRFQTFVRIYIPLGRPMLASLAVLKFITTWNEYTWPFVMTNSDSMKTVQVALTVFRDETLIPWNQLMAATLMSSLVIYVLYIFAQKQFVEGILAGSIKE